MVSRDTVKFLLVDDLDENLVALEALLRRDDLELIKAKSGAEALEMLLVNDIALALLDVQMPGMDGFELAELMRGLERTRRVPIIFVTALSADETRRFRGYETGAVDYLQKPIDPQVLANKAGVFFELARQRQELRDNAAKLQEALDQAQAHADNSPLALVQFDSAFRITSWSDGARRLFGWLPHDVLGRSYKDIDWLRATESDRFDATAAPLLQGQGAGRDICELTSYAQDGTCVFGEWYVSALFDRFGKLSSLSAQILDITERKRAEETQRLLVGELNHRVKNTLATVQAVATQTLRHSSDAATFAKTFVGRIQSLAKAHSLLSDATWSGACVAKIISDQLDLGTLDCTRFSASGPAIQLKPQSALHLAMIVHELATNAGKYGAHSTPTGSVAVEWTVQGTVLQLYWRERGGPAVDPVRPKGFGTRMIEQSAKAEGGQATMNAGPDGLTWAITMEMGSVVAFDMAKAHNASPRSTPKAPPVLPARNNVNKRLLIIEDEPLVALDIADALENAKFEVVGTATSVEEALHMIANNRLDCVLLDGNLRGEPVDAVAALLEQKGVPFMFVSGYGKDSLPETSTNVAVLMKPFNPEQLIAAAEALISST